MELLALPQGEFEVLVTLKLIRFNSFKGYIDGRLRIANPRNAYPSPFPAILRFVYSNVRHQNICSSFDNWMEVSCFVNFDTSIYS